MHECTHTHIYIYIHIYNYLWREEEPSKMSLYDGSQTTTISFTSIIREKVYKLPKKKHIKILRKKEANYKLR